MKKQHVVPIGFYALIKQVIALKTVLPVAHYKTGSVTNAGNAHPLQAYDEKNLRHYTLYSAL